MKNRLITILTFIALITVGCSSEMSEEKIKVGALAGPTGMGMVHIMDNDNYDFTISASPDEIVGKIINGEFDIAAIPANMALLLYNRTEGDIMVTAVNALGSLYLLENGEDIISFEDLSGQNINISGKGATPDFVFQYLANQNGLSDVVIDYSLNHLQLSAAVAQGDVKLALLPQPHATVAMQQNKDIRVALDINDEWLKHNSTNPLTMGVLVVQREFATKNPNLLNEFLKEYEKSIELTNSDIEESARLIEKHNIIPNAEVAKNAIPLSNIVYIDAIDARDSLDKFYEVLYDLNPKSIGERLADDAFYYEK